AVALIEPDMRQAGWEREQRRRAALPPIKDRHRCFEQAMRDAAAPMLGMHRERAEEAKAAPAARDRDAGDRAVLLGDQRAIRPGAAARFDKPRRAGKAERVGEAEISAESQTADLVRGFDIGFFEG